MSKKPLRERMPGVAAQIDALRLRHGSKPVDERIRRAQAGEPAFYAIEGDHTFGVPPTGLAGWVESIDAVFGGGFSLIAYECGTDLKGDIDPDTMNAAPAVHRGYCSGCTGSCVGTARRCSEHRLHHSRQTTAERARELWVTEPVHVPAEADESAHVELGTEYLAEAR